MRIELLYFEGCPGYEELLPRLRELAVEAGSEVLLRPIETIETAQAERFLGSPTVRVDGRDVDPGAQARTDFGLNCRIYRSAAGQARTPPEEWIRDALQRRAANTM